jgi:hypothetical protein
LRLQPAPASWWPRLNAISSFLGSGNWIRTSEGLTSPGYEPGAIGHYAIPLNSRSPDCDKPRPSVRTTCRWYHGPTPNRTQFQPNVSQRMRDAYLDSNPDFGAVYGNRTRTARLGRPACPATHRMLGADSGDRTRRRFVGNDSSHPGVCPLTNWYPPRDSNSH